MSRQVREPSDAILTAPNVITFARLALVPVYMWLALARHKIGAAFWLGLFIGLTDFVDGAVARKFNQVSKLGATLDPLFDRVAVAAAAIVLLGLHLAPWPMLAVVLARDIALVAASPFIQRKGIERPAVSMLGKWGSFGTMYSFGVMLASGVDLGARHAFRALAWWTYVPAVFFSYGAALGYFRTVRTELRAKRVAG